MKAKENVLKSGTKLQKITNPKTLKKIAKSKERKLLKVVPDDVVNGGSKKGMKTKKSYYTQPNAPNVLKISKVGSGKRKLRRADPLGPVSDGTKRR
ncbi:uncharacterized protein A4U43_C04F16370 [Asparagus officinalis]|uniref:Coiled-coil domain-containing protein 86 n=1 Tax=Asparagus officinalis TaxID=4686 RepID=A0A5P1F1B1_ASPOF|nr:uncharacterized protein A4U43_C04F16370 [Asparagus officinalis]